MLRVHVACVAMVVAMGLAGCAKPPQTRESLSAYSAVDEIMTGSIGPRATFVSARQPMPGRPSATLAGRTLAIADEHHLSLLPGEVVLTFDDGPRPGKTDRILDALDAYGVKATFFMLGAAAEHHPELVRAVAGQGHTIATHTYDHVDLATLSLPAAIAEIYAGHQAVARALAPVHGSPSRFFRFPYLSQTGLIRTGAIESNFIVVDVDVDSKDYYDESADVVLDRTLARLEARGSGVVLFHDIHERTADLLPDFLAALKARGYSVVALRSSGGSVFDQPEITAELRGSLTF